MTGMDRTELRRRADHMEKLIRRYFDACNQADQPAIAASFTPDGTHYFPPGMYEGPFRGGETIARRWADCVDRLGSVWTVDRLLVHPETWQAVMEWTHFKTRAGTMLRGIEWYEFDPVSRLIREIRAYYATPQPDQAACCQLGGFDYDARGYPAAPPPVAR